jgi:hypothetical protein
VGGHSVLTHPRTILGLTGSFDKLHIALSNKK